MPWFAHWQETLEHCQTTWQDWVQRRQLSSIEQAERQAAHARLALTAHFWVCPQTRRLAQDDDPVARATDPVEDCRTCRRLITHVMDAVRCLRQHEVQADRLQMLGRRCREESAPTEAYEDEEISF